jgi:carbon monoxide dehydrogenase subunit G
VRIENRFEAPAAADEVWALLTDVPRVVPCLPGAELVGQVDDTTWKANVKVKLGPIAMAFAANVREELADQDAHHLRLVVDAREVHGRGGSRAAIEATVQPSGAGSAVEIVTDLTLSGAVAQYGRGVVPGVAGQLVAEFAACLRSQLDGAPAARPRAARGGRLLLRALLAPLGLRRAAVGER